MEKETQFVRFENNNSKRWDGKERLVPAETVVRTGKRGANGLEQAEVHWPGKGGKGTVIWNCVILEDTEEKSTAGTSVEGTSGGKDVERTTAGKGMEESGGKRQRGRGKKKTPPPATVDNSHPPTPQPRQSLSISAPACKKRKGRQGTATCVTI